MNLRLLAISTLLLVIGCIGGGDTTTTTTSSTQAPTTTETTSTSISTTSTTTQATTSTNPAFPECESLNATFWRAICLDDKAYESGNPRLCATAYCLARFSGERVCDHVQLNSTDWRSFKIQACKAWANGREFDCDGIMRSGDCIRWYYLLANDMSSCMRAQNNPGDDCATEFAKWRGNATACKRHKTKANILECLSEHYKMVALDKNDTQYCARIEAPRARGECLDAVDYNGPVDRHPLYGINEQLITR